MRFVVAPEGAEPEVNENETPDGDVAQKEVVRFDVAVDDPC
jgi:hypothetical protein